MTRTNILNLITSKVLTGGARTTAAFLRDVYNEITNSSFIKDTDTADNITDGSIKVLMTSTERTKLTGVAEGAEVNPSAAEIKTEYESNANTNAFDDDYKSQLDLSLSPTRELTAVLNMSAPTPSISIMQSTFSSNPTISNTGPGVYQLQTPTLFSVGRTFVSITGNASAFISVQVANDNQININTRDASGTSTDGLVTAGLLKISVYA